MFVYNVNGTILETEEAFGEVWRQAKALAKEEKTFITRCVVKGDSVKEEFYHKAGIFLSIKLWDKNEAKIF